MSAHGTASRFNLGELYGGDARPAVLCLHVLVRTGAERKLMTELTYQPELDGRFHPLWDIRIAKVLTGPEADLWPPWDTLAHITVLLVYGEASDILMPAAVARMRTDRPDMRVVCLPSDGHAPVLTEAPALTASLEFLEYNA